MKMTREEMLNLIKTAVGKLDNEWNRMALKSQNKMNNYYGELVELAFRGRIKPELIEGFRKAVKGASSLEEVSERALEYILKHKPK